MENSESQLPFPRLSTLQTIPFFNSLSTSALENLAQCSSFHCYDTNEVVFQQGDIGDCLLLILSGDLAVTLQNSEGKEIFINMVLSGEILGEIALFDEKPRTANAITLTPCTIIHIPKIKVIKIMENNGVAAMQLVKFLCQRVRDTMVYAENISLYNLEERLARLFYYLILRFGGKINNNIEIKHKLVQSHLASMVNASRPKVNQCLQNWQKNNILNIQRDCIIIYDQKKLMSIAKI